MGEFDLIEFCCS